MVSGSYWLMKAEPDSRVVKEKDVKVRDGCVVILSVIQVAGTRSNTLLDVGDIVSVQCRRL
jgi:hypothetical protein